MLQPVTFAIQLYGCGTSATDDVNQWCNVESVVGGQSGSMASLILPPGAQQLTGKSRAGKNPARQTDHVMHADHVYPSMSDFTCRHTLTLTCYQDIKKDHLQKTSHSYS